MCIESYNDQTLKSKLALANYAIDPELLTDYIPRKTELDYWNNTCYVSLVGFMFLNTRLLGIPIPFHRNFEEVNLRFYVRYKDKNEWKRGVVFIKEIVPKHALTFVANTVYGEHYQTMKMNHQWSHNGAQLNVRYSWWNKNVDHCFSVTADGQSKDIVAGSEVEFITEHYWGYTRINANKTFEYEVTHPKWQYYPVRSYDIKMDFATLYGSEFNELNQAKPLSVMLAEGSDISVENKKSI